MIAALKRMGTIVILAMVCFGLLWVGYIYFAQESLMYYPRGYTEAELDFVRDEVAQLRRTTAAGEQVAFYRAPEGGGEPERLWLLFGGNGARALDWFSFVESLGMPRTGFLLVDYPGYGLCEGKPSPKSIEESIESVFDECAKHLGLDRAVLAKKTAAMGHSLGASAALMAMEKFELNQAVLVSPFTTMKEMAEKLVGGPLSNLVRHRFDNRKPIRTLMEREGVKITIIHGADDRDIPVEMGRELSEIAPQRIAFHAVPGADHNDVIMHAFALIRQAMR